MIKAQKEVLVKNYGQNLLRPYLTQFHTPLEGLELKVAFYNCCRIFDFNFVL